MLQQELDETSGIQVLKDSSTYPLWNAEVKILFGAKDLWSVVSGEETLESCGVDVEKKKKGNIKDSRAKYIIMKTLDKSIKTQVITYDTSKNV